MRAVAASRRCWSPMGRATTRSCSRPPALRDDERRHRDDSTAAARRTAGYRAPVQLTLPIRDRRAAMLCSVVGVLLAMAACSMPHIDAAQDSHADTPASGRQSQQDRQSSRTGRRHGRADDSGRQRRRGRRRRALHGEPGRGQRRAGHGGLPDRGRQGEGGGGLRGSQRPADVRGRVDRGAADRVRLRDDRVDESPETLPSGSAARRGRRWR